MSTQCSTTELHAHGARHVATLWPGRKAGTRGGRHRFLGMPDATEAAMRAGTGDSVIGWKLDRDQRAELLRRFPPKFRNPVADHVTLAGHAEGGAPLPQETDGEIVGRADDGRGVEAMVVRIGGTTDRPDGSTYHITWSLAGGRRAKESNEVIAARGWASFAEPVPFRLIPARFGKS